MNPSIQHALELAVHGLLTELPAQLITAAVAAATTALIRVRGKRQPANVTKTGTEPN
ncbi:hypothetical protein [Streptomyces ortus]|uniref:Holin n=1 Tax=Streptomyces ortus TaxID=2867268 RepID=A0ABT3UWD4_9ACTN|nr:hypothetical protein [Streptomyces ortus]MCX4231846.1 hypothetical protein [Streptomyces ortus]